MQARLQVDCEMRRVLLRAMVTAGAPARLSIEGLFLSLLAVDCTFVFRKFRRIRIRPPDIIKEVHACGANSPAGDPAGVLIVLQLADSLAPAGVPINTQHLFVAIVLEDTNRVSRFLLTAGVDRPHFILKNFPYMPRAADVLQGAAGEGPGYRGPESEVAAAEALSQALRLATDPLRPAPVAWAGPTERTPHNGQAAPPAGAGHQYPVPAEQTARWWLRKLIPYQAATYDTAGYVDIASALVPERIYRIYRSDRRTDFLERGERVASGCVHFKRQALPATDRVIAEYFLIRGDEKRYLKTANIAPF